MLRLGKTYAEIASKLPFMLLPSVSHYDWYKKLLNLKEDKHDTKADYIDLGNPK